MISFCKNRVQRYSILPIQPNKLHKISHFVHTLADLCNYFRRKLIIINSFHSFLPRNSNGIHCGSTSTWSATLAWMM